MFTTNDLIIRSSLKKDLEILHSQDKEVKIIEELGVLHGTARIDVAVINGCLHGYEIKSDRDTLQRLPEQIEVFNLVFDRLTLVVGKRHLFHAMHCIPDWWGVMLAKTNTKGKIIFQTIRQADTNKKEQAGISIAELLWKEEALQILEEKNSADGVRSKPRQFIYERLAEILDTETLKHQVSTQLISRKGWPSD